MFRVKICGITSIEDAIAAAEAGADAVGFVFAESPRRVEPDLAREVAQLMPAHVQKVGVFVDEDPAVVEAVASAAGLDVLQLHGAEPPEYCRKLGLPVVKAWRVGVGFDFRLPRRYEVAGHLFDARVSGKVGGTGCCFDWSLMSQVDVAAPVILSGGLSPENVTEAIRRVRPWGVDSCSGVEKVPGRKDHARLHQFVHAARLELTRPVSD